MLMIALIGQMCPDFSRDQSAAFYICHMNANLGSYIVRYADQQKNLKEVLSFHHKQLQLYE